MGFELIPGHRQSGMNGWQEITNLSTDFLDNIKLGHFDLGNFGNWYSEGDDKYAGHYSIPNPWAAAYLFHTVLRTGTHPLRPKILFLLLNLLNDFHCLHRLELLTFEPHASSQSFRIFWNLVPPFLLFDGKIILLRDNYESKIIGGLSKTTLFWSSQSYMGRSSMEDLINNKALGNYLTHIMNKRLPENIFGMDFNTFWSHEILGDLVGNVSTTIEEFKLIDAAPAPWLVTHVGREIDPKYVFNGRLIFDEVALTTDNSILGYPNPPGLIEELKKQKQGNTLPFGQKEYKWTLFQNLLEENWVRISSAAEDENRKTFLGKVLLPIKPEYLKIGFDLSLINRKPDAFAIIGNRAGYTYEQSYIGNNGQKRIFRHNINGVLCEDRRNLAIWPPFPSKFINTHIMELNPSGIKDINHIELFDISGNKLAYEIISENEASRIYRLTERSKFPYFIRIITANGTGGILRIDDKYNKPNNKAINIGIDFGSTHTTVAYRVLGESDKLSSKLMVFENSGPIILSDETNRFPILANFIPEKILEQAPDNEKAFLHGPGGQLCLTTWAPFRTFWKILNVNSVEFLESGIIPLTYDPEKFIDQKPNTLVENIKWNSESKDRNGFLTQLLNMIIVEAEAMGYTNININWSYPLSFSSIEVNTMTEFYTSYSKQCDHARAAGMQINVHEAGFSEAVRTLHYCIQNIKLNQNQLAATIDIGGGTTDITFFQHEKAKWQDSVKFGGDDISQNVEEIISTLNAMRQNRGDYKINKAGKYDYNQIIRTWPAVHRTWNGCISNFMNTNVKKGQFIERLALFYGGICYFIGMHLKRRKEEQIRQIAFAGNGIQFLKIFSSGTELTEKSIWEWFELFRRMIASGHGIAHDDLSNIKILFTKDPKKEVAFGLTYMDKSESGDGEFRIERMLGLGLGSESQSILWSEWTNAPSNQLAEHFDIDYSNFQEFISSFYSCLKEICVKHGKANSFQHVQISDTQQLTDDFKDRVQNEITKRGNIPLASPPFFTALKIWIENKI